MRRIHFLVLAAIAVAAGLFGAGTLAPRIASADVTTWDAKIVGALENPPVTNDAMSAFVRFRFDDVTQSLQYDVTVSGVSPDQVTAAHIHRGAKGVNGPIVYTLSDKGFTQISGSVKLTDSDVVDLLVGDFYINVHTKDHPGGAARAQLDLPVTANDVVATFRRFVAVGNRGNVDAILGYFASNASFTDGRTCPPNTCVGQDAIRAYFESAIASHTSSRNLQLTQRGNNIDYRAEFLNDATKAAGIDRIIAAGSVVFAGGKISVDTIGFDLSDPQTARFLAAAGAGGGARISPPATGDAGLAAE